MYCTNCGKELSDGAAVCDECGTSFTPDGQAKAPAEDISRQDTAWDNGGENTAGGASENSSSEEPRRPYMDYQPFSGQNETNFQAGQNTYEEYGNQQGSYEQNPYGQNPYGQSPYGQNPYGQNPYGQNPYGQNTYKKDGGEEGHTGLAIASLVLGIIGTCCCCLPLLCIPIGIVGLIFGIIGMKSSSRGLAIAGLVLSSIALVLGVMMILVMIVSGDSYISYHWNW
ncbi:zinc-ribbon domain-containing protein [Qiania dongpingensis]|uniref:Zinc-ribbon domain-containing protein n=1 Tax=Qiania dongpingensis TaxID=2763669 RepID=A0A7G9G1R6_9FIRM|nr:zinc-ribbon domain-containing protein [Qiania dongpingensis]QNM04748.1 zinc-ribbon domain-containing protein [Qiania dongpingensis]